jgi:hypothetical protein
MDAVRWAFALVILWLGVRAVWQWYRGRDEDD